MNELSRRAQSAMPPLMRVAVMSGADELVRRQLARGVGVDVTDERGRTALLLAAARGHLSTCRLLLEAGADPRHRDLDGLDALGVASAAGHSQVHGLIQAALSPRRAIEVPATSPDVELDSSKDESEVDDGWEVEEAPQQPLGDSQVVLEAVRTQAQLSAHRPLDESADWSDVEIRLPRPPRRHQVAVDLDEEVVAQWRNVIDRGLRQGAVPLGAVLAAGSASGDEEDVSCLLQALEEAGVMVEEFDPWSEAVDDTEDDTDVVENPDDPIAAAMAMDDDGSDLEPDDTFADEEDTDPLARVFDLRRQRDLLYWQYLSGLPGDRLTREEEERLGRVMEEGQRMALQAVVGSPALTHLLERLVTDGPGTGEEDVGPRAADTRFLQHVRNLQASKARRLDPPASTRITADARVLVGHLANQARLEGIDPGEREPLERGHKAWNDAWLRMVMANLRLVVHGTSRVRRGHIPVSDLIQEGNVGLMRAVEKYDHRSGNSFGTYAIWWIRAKVDRHVSRFPVVSISAGATEARSKVASAQRLLEAQGVYDASVLLISETVGLPVETVERAMASPIMVIPIRTEGVDAEAAEAIEDAVIIDHEMTTPEEGAAVSELWRRVMVALDGSSIPPKAARALRLRFGLDDGEERTLSEVGDVMRLSRERIRQLVTVALSELRRLCGVAAAVGEDVVGDV